MEKRQLVPIARQRLAILLIAALTGGCGDDRSRDSSAALLAASLPGVYEGVYPCDGCPGITATLWLRGDGRYFFRQQYPADSDREAFAAFSLGRWTSIADDRRIELAGAGPGRSFIHSDRDTLLMETDSDLEYRLTRDPAQIELSATIRMAGTMRMRGDDASFTECWTGFVAPVSKGGDFARFRHHYRSAGRPSEPTFVELEGRFSWADDGALRSLTIERFVTVKAEGGC